MPAKKETKGKGEIERKGDREKERKGEREKERKRKREMGSVRVNEGEREGRKRHEETEPETARDSETPRGGE